MAANHRLQITFLILGVIAGFLLFHPYTMLVYYLMNIHDHEVGGVNFEWEHLIDTLRSTFNRMMLPMAASFAFFGGIIGLLLGILIDRRRKLEEKRVALETLRRLMVTLSHYLLNANTIIGGMARRCKRIASNEDIPCPEVIGEQAKKIDAVLKALKEVTEIKIADYTTEGKALMIDITREIEELLKDQEKHQI